MKRAPSIVVSQTLHGYNDGHRLLASSSQELTSKDQQSLLIMSDASGGSLDADDRGYLTGYPLEGSGVYALARTWAAPEMPRPGCVWTHTLLIDFADLASMQDLGCLRRLFRRPAKESFGEYGGAIRLPLDSGSNQNPRFIDGFSANILRGIYGSTKSFVLRGRPLDENEEEQLLQVWSQQWPRLRRSFSFCTSVASDTSATQMMFDLQLHVDSTPRVIVQPRIAGKTDWVSLSIADLRKPTSLRSFLREVAIDLKVSGREAFPALVSIHELIERDTAEGFAQAVDLANQKILKAEGGDQLRLTMLKRCVASLDDSADGDARKDFLKSNRSKLTAEIAERGLQQGASTLWQAVPDVITAWLSAEDSKRLVALEVIRSVTAEQLLSALPSLGDGASDVIAVRPDVLTLKEIWSRASGSIKRRLLDLVPSNWPRWNETVSAIIASGASDLAGDVKRVSGGDQFIGAVLDQFRTQAVTHYSRTEWEWARVAVSDHSAVAHYLATGQSFTESQLYTLTQLIRPDDVPNNFGHDPWLEAMARTEVSSLRFEHEYVCAYLLARALGRTSRSQAELIRHTFDTVFSAAQNESISRDAWNLLEWRLPDSKYWFSWSKCRQLKEGIAEAFVSRSLLPDQFALVTANDWLFEDLISAVIQHRGGREYLRDVHGAMLKMPNVSHRRISAVADSF